jgi:CheY-like chemotaxis protein
MTARPLEGVSVLVVEDHEDHRDIARTLLMRAGARVRAVRGGEDGLAAIERACPDLILCDLLMPRMDGFEFARRVRRMPQCGRVRLIAVTALRDASAPLHTWSVGYDGHIEKPLTVEKLEELAARFARGAVTRPHRRSPPRRRGKD